MIPERPTFVDDNGYLRFQDTNQLVHRAIAQLMVGHSLSQKEVVHHKDMDKKNNDPSNLIVCESQDEHERLHHGTYSQPKINSVLAFILFLILSLSIGLGFLLLVYGLVSTFLSKI